MALSVQELLDTGAELELTVLTGEPHSDRRITARAVQRLGLVLAGYTAHVDSGRPQIIGRSEHGYLASLNLDARERVRGCLSELDVPCIIATHGGAVPAWFVDACREASLPLCASALSTKACIHILEEILGHHLRPTAHVHGVLLDILRIGVLLTGKSGIGKSECALDLVSRGHRLVADDVVELRRLEDDVIDGACSRRLSHHMEIRGLGVINVKDLFGVASVRNRKYVQLVVELVSWEEAGELHRLGVEEQRYEALGVSLPMVRVPVRPGRNLAVIIEAAARDQLLKRGGHDSAALFVERLDAELRRRGDVADADGGDGIE